MISFDEFLKQDEADKYNMLLECNAIIQQKENIIKEVREYIETKEKDDNNWVDYELLIEPIRIKEILDKVDKENI